MQALLTAFKLINHVLMFEYLLKEKKYDLIIMLIIINLSSIEFRNPSVTERKRKNFVSFNIIPRET